MLKYRDISVGFVPKDETTSDAADGAADPKMRFIWGIVGMVYEEVSKTSVYAGVRVRVPCSPPASQILE